MKIVLVGGGKVGAALARQLSEEGHNVTVVDTTTTLLGRPSALPLALAPTGFTRMMHHQGERAVVRVADQVGIPYALSTLGTTSIEDVAAAAPAARKWFQLYVWRDPGA